MLELTKSLPISLSHSFYFFIILYVFIKYSPFAETKPMINRNQRDIRGSTGKVNWYLKTLPQK